MTSQACKIAGGAWTGGHDISGHVFILVLGGAFLGMELLPVFMKKKGLKDERVMKRRDGNFGKIEGLPVGDEDDSNETESIMEKVGTWTPAIVSGLSWWMLLMTAAYFHTWFEKVSPRGIYPRYTYTILTECRRLAFWWPSLHSL